MEISERKKQLYATAKTYIDNERIEILDKFINEISKVYGNSKNYFGALFIDEAFDLALIISQNIGLGFSAILSVFLFRACINKLIDEKFILKYLPASFANQAISIIRGTESLSKMDNESVFGTTKEDYNKNAEVLTKREKKFSKSYEQYLTEQGELFRQFFLSVSKDVRVILIKLAFHYYKIKNIESFDERKRMINCHESRYLYAPIAHQIGLYNIKADMEETAMKYINTDIYENIINVLAESKESREKYIENFIQPIKKSLAEMKIEAVVKGRPKSIHSIWNKMIKQQVTIDKIYDLFAIRIILLNEFADNSEEKAACWAVYSKITDVWKPNPNRLKDWVSAPKASGYESLHTTVIGPEGKWVEVQIRTKRMDEIAEKGNAAHWKYKEIRGAGHDDWLSNIRAVIENPMEQNEDDFVKRELYSDTIFVYTPKGELIKLKEGATVLDFAYRLHSQIGAKCSGAKIEDKMVGIRQKLKNGDVVEVLTSKNQFPRSEWLEIATSSHAKSRIKRALKEIEDEKIEAGKLFLLDIIEQIKTKYKKPDFAWDNKKLNQLRRKLDYESINDFYVALANRLIKIDVDYLYKFFIEPTETTYENILKKLNEQLIDSESTSKKSSQDFLVIDNSVSGIKFEFAKCCNPIPGDKIFAYVTATSGTKIHKLTCPNAKELITRFPYRVIPATWKKTDMNQKFKAKIRIISQQTPGIIAKISEIISNSYAVELYDININPTNNKTYEGTIGVMVNSIEFLNILIDKIKSINGVMAANREEKV